MIVRSLVTAPFFMGLSASSRIYGDVSNAEVTFKRTGIHRYVLDVFECDGRFVDDPDAASYTDATPGKDIPGRVVTKMNGDVGDDVWKHRDRKRNGREPQCQRGTCGEQDHPTDHDR